MSNFNKNVDQNQFFNIVLFQLFYFILLNQNPLIFFYSSLLVVIT